MRQTKTPHSCGHRVARLATLVMLLGFLGALQSKAQTAYALYNDSTLTFYYDENQPDSNYFDMSFHTDPAYGKVPSWYELCDSVDTIVFDASFADYRPTDCTAWFCGYYLLKNIDGMENLHTDSVKSMNNMFCACSNLYNVDLSHFNTENVEDMSRMFYFSTGFSTLDLSYFNTKNVKDMSEMFYWSYYLGTIFASETFTVESVENSTDMFTGCTALEGAILYDPVRTSARYANYVDGYFTYKDPTAIAPATRTAQDEPIDRYDLQGRRLTAPQRGVNIVKQGNKTTKVLVK